MLKVETEEGFQNLKIRLIEKFIDKTNVMKYLRNLIRDIENNCLFPIYNQYTGFRNKLATNNICESVNSLLKRFLNNKKNSPDSLLLALFHLQNSLIHEFERSSRCRGKFNFDENFTCDFKFNLGEFIELEHIVDYIKESSFESKFKIKNEERISDLHMAKNSIERHAIRSYPHGIFSVQSFADPTKLFTVNLKEKKCSCKQKINCYHQLACQIFSGQYKPNEESDYNLTKIVLAKEEALGKSGRKRPRRVDKSDNLTAEKDSGAKIVKIDLSLESINLFDEKPDSNSSIEEIGEKIVNEKEVEELLMNEIPKAQEFIQDTTPVLTPPKTRQLLRSSLKSEWEGLRSEKQTFHGKFVSLNPDQMLTNFVINDAFLALISMHHMTDFVSFLMETSIDAVLKNFNDTVLNEIYRRALLNKQLIFILMKSEYVQYPYKQHWFLGVTDMKNERIIILDSLPGKLLVKHYSISFYAILKIVQLLYSARKELLFNQSDWKLIICPDVPKQKDGTSCGCFVLSFVHFILSQMPFAEIDNQNKFRKWIGNVIKHYGCNQDINLDNVEMLPADFYELKDGKVKLTSTAKVTENLIEDIQGTYNGDECAWSGCEGDEHKQIICTNCRLYFHQHAIHSDHFFTPFKLCENCFTKLNIDETSDENI